MKLSKKMIIGISLLIIIPFIIIQLYAIILAFPLLTDLSIIIGFFLAILGQGALLYYLLFKCKYRWINRLFPTKSETSINHL